MSNIQLTKIKHDINGNPRYVVHFTEFFKDRSANELKADFGTCELGGLYRLAVKAAHKIGGRKYHTKSYGGGIVFQSYNVDDLKKDIKRVRI